MVANIKFCVSFLLFVFLIGGLKQVKAEGEKKALLIIARQNFRDEELFAPKQVLEQNGYKVVIASSSLGEAKGKLGGKIKPDILLENAAVSDYSIIAFIGGPGAQEYFDSQAAHRIAREAYNNNKVLGAICIAPSILARAGVLDGKKATVFDSEAMTLKSKGAIYTGKDVEVSGKIITANGPHAAKMFGEALVEADK